MEGIHLNFKTDIAAIIKTGTQAWKNPPPAGPRLPIPSQRLQDSQPHHWHRPGKLSFAQGWDCPATTSARPLQSSSSLRPGSLLLSRSSRQPSALACSTRRASRSLMALTQLGDQIAEKHSENPTFIGITAHKIKPGPLC